jgi:hypothetical protein
LRAHNAARIDLDQWNSGECRQRIRVDQRGRALRHVPFGGYESGSIVSNLNGSFPARHLRRRGLKLQTIHATIKLTTIRN